MCRRNTLDFSTTRLKGGLARTTNGVVALRAFDVMHQTTTPCGVRAENMQLYGFPYNSRSLGHATESINTIVFALSVARRSLAGL